MLFFHSNFNHYLIKAIIYEFINSIKVPRDSVNLLRTSDVMKLHTDLEYLTSERCKKELGDALKMLDLHLNKLRNIHGQSFSLPEQKRKWSPNDGYFYFRNSREEEILGEKRDHRDIEYQANINDNDRDRVISKIFRTSGSPFRIVETLGQKILATLSLLESRIDE